MPKGGPVPVQKKPTHVSLNSVKRWYAAQDKKALIQNLILAGALTAFICFLFIPVFLQNQAGRHEVKRLKLLVQGAHTKIAKIPEMQKQKEMYGARIEEIRDQFFEHEESDQLIEVISRAASETGVKISASKPVEHQLALPPPHNEMYKVVAYELDLEGPYHSIGTFVNRLEQYPKNFAVHEFEIKSGKSAPTVQEASVIVNAFLKKPESGT